MRIANLTIGYPGHPLYSGLTAQLPPGRLTCLLGPNGAGKSTLLKTLCGLLPALGGAVEVGGASLCSLSPGQLARCVSVVLTRQAAPVSMSAREVIALGRTPYTNLFGTLSAGDEAVVSASAGMVGAEQLLHRSVSSLSDGERQKVSIAAALAQQTPVILLDEPSAFLDFPNKVRLLQLLRQLAEEQQKSILLSTHDLHLALRFSHHLWLLHRELGFVQGPTASLVESGVVERYFSVPGFPLQL